MKWRSIFGKKRTKDEEMEDYYSQITSPKPLSRSDSAPCFPASLAQLSLTSPLPNSYLPPSFAMTTSMTENMWSSSSQQQTPVAVPRPPTLLPPKCEASPSYELPSPGSPVSVAFCPKCHTIVQPISKRRSKIRTNPWLQCSTTGLPKSNSVLATTPGTTIADSGISDNHFMSDASPATSEARSIPITAADDRFCQYAKVIRSHSNLTSSSSVIHYPKTIESSNVENIKLDDVNKKRRKKKKHRRKKSVDSLEQSENKPVDSKPIVPPRYVQSAANQFDKPNDLSNSRHHLSNRPLPRVHEDEILMSSSVIYQPVPAMVTQVPSNSASLTDVRCSTVTRQHLRQRIEALKADKRHLEQQFSQAQMQFRKSQAGVSGFNRENGKEERDKQALLNTLASAHRRMDHQIASLMATWRSLFDYSDRTAEQQYSYYDYSNSHIASLPRHW